MADIQEARRLIALKEQAVTALEEHARKARADLEGDKKKLELLSNAVTSLIRSNSVTTDANPIGLASAYAKASAFSDDTSTPGGTTTYGSVKRAMKEAIAGILNPIFTTRDVIDHMAILHPEINVDGNRANISNYLRDFVAEGLIKLEQEGSGQRPASYRRSTLGMMAESLSQIGYTFAANVAAIKKPQ